MSYRLTVAPRAGAWTVNSLLHCRWRRLIRFVGQDLRLMPHDPAFDQVDQILGDVGGMVRDPFQMPRDMQDLKQGLEELSVAGDRGLDLREKFTWKCVDFSVGGAPARAAVSSRNFPAG